MAMFGRYIALTGMLAVASVSSAAEIAIRDEASGPVVTVTGKLVDYDARAFLSLTANLKQATVVLNSKGGSLYAGLEIGKAIRHLGFATRVSSTIGVCSSACAFAWLAGTPRQLDASAKVGFHAAYVLENGRPVMTGPANARVGAYIRDLGLSDAVIAYTTSARPDAMTWLTAKDAASIGLAVEYVNDTALRSAPLAAEFLPRGDIPVPERAPRIQTETAALSASPLRLASSDWKFAPGFRLVGPAATISLKTRTETECLSACDIVGLCVAYSFDIPNQQCALWSGVDSAAPDRSALSAYKPVSAQQ